MFIDFLIIKFTTAKNHIQAAEVIFFGMSFHQAVYFRLKFQYSILRLNQEDNNLSTFD